MSTVLHPATIWHTSVDDAPVVLNTVGGLIAIGGAGGTAWLLEAATGQPRGTYLLPGGMLDVALAPDASHLAVTGPLGYGIWQARTGQAILRKSGQWSARAHWVTSDRVAIADGRTAVVLDSSGQELWRTVAAPSTVTDLAWLREGKRLAVTAYNGVYCHERHQAAPVTTYPYGGSHLTIAVTPNGRWICTGNQDASIHIWRARDGAELTMSGYPQKVSHLAFDATGRWLAADGAPEVTVWDFAGKGPAGSTPRLLPGHDGVTALAWRPGESGVLATGGREGNVFLWRPATGRPSRAMSPLRTWALGSEVSALAWPDPQHVVIATGDGQISCLSVDVA
jgi:WD40 repeat protein